MTLKLAIQAVSDAHSILSNEVLRRRYDERGYSALGSQYAEYAAFGESLARMIRWLVEGFQVLSRNRILLSNENCQFGLPIGTERWTSEQAHRVICSSLCK